MAELNKMAAVQSNIPDRQLFESSLPVAERVLALVLECLLEPLPLAPCTSACTGRDKWHVQACIDNVSMHS